MRSIAPVLGLALLAATVFTALPAGAEEKTAPGEQSNSGVKIYSNTDEDRQPMGRRVITDSQGRKSIVYSTGKPRQTAREKREQAQRDKDQAMELMKSIIIDTRQNSEVPVYTDNTGSD